MSSGEARALKATGRAVDEPREVDLRPARQVQPPPMMERAAEPATATQAPVEVQPVPEDEREKVLFALRQRAEALGVTVDRRWGEDRLRSEIEAARIAQHRYERRDLQAKE